MNPLLLLLLVPAIVVVLITRFKWHETVSIREMIVQLIVPLIVISVVWNVSKYSGSSDTEIINGKVTGKEQERVSCSHSYECRCHTVRSGSGKNRTSRRECSTCYRHSNDWDWRVYTSLGEFNVERIDSRGKYEPERWTKVQVNQPVAEEQSYTNWVRAAPDSLFHMTKAQSYKGKPPDYPKVYDYQYIDRVISVGMKVPDLAKWNDTLSRSLNDMGKAKQVNINLILTDNPPRFADALRFSWLGGKKNDVTVIIGGDYPQISWVRVFSWAKHDIINVALRDHLLDSKTLNPDTTVGIISKDVMQYYERRPMEDFAYLEDEISPPTWVLILALILSTGSAIGLGFVFHHHDPFGGPTNRNFRTRY